MLIASRQKNHVMILELSGRFDFRARKVFQASMRNALEQTSRCLVIDLTHVFFVDSAALGLLALWHSRLREEGVLLRLAGATGYIHKVFELFRIAQLIPTFPTVEAAICATPVCKTTEKPASARAD